MRFKFGFEFDLTLYFQAVASNFHSEGLKFIPKLPVDVNNSSFPGQWHRL